MNSPIQGLDSAGPGFRVLSRQLDDKGPLAYNKHDGQASASAGKFTSRGFLSGRVARRPFHVSHRANGVIVLAAASSGF